MNIHDIACTKIASLDKRQWACNDYNYGISSKAYLDISNSDYSQYDAEFSLNQIMGLCSLHDVFSDDNFLVFPQCQFNSLG